MSIGIIGSGYVGTVTGAGLAARGNEVFFVDFDPDRVEALNRAASPLFEPGLDALLANNRGRDFYYGKFYSTLRAGEMDEITVVEKRLDLLVCAKLRDRTRLERALLTQDRLREKSKAWDGVEELRRWRDSR